MKTIASNEILKMEDLYQLQDEFRGSGIPFSYEITDGELGWLDFVSGKYFIADWVEENLVCIEDEKTGHAKYILEFDNPDSLSESLEEDGMSPKAVCLDENTALARLFFWLS